MPAAAMKRMGKKLRSQKDLARQQYQQYGGKLARKAGAGGVSAAVMPDRGPMPSDMGGRGRIDMGPTPDQGMMGQAGEVIRRRRQAEMPAPGAGQPEISR